MSGQNKELGARVLTLQFGTKLSYKLVIQSMCRDLFCCPKKEGLVLWFEP